VRRRENDQSEDGGEPKSTADEDGAGKQQPVDLELTREHRHDRQRRHAEAGREEQPPGVDIARKAGDATVKTFTTDGALHITVNTFLLSTSQVLLVDLPLTECIDATAYTGVEWQVDETADRMIREKLIPPMILVGIDNAQKDRPKEYLSYRSLNPPQLRPQGRRYPDFLINEVMPFLYERYRIGRGPENTGLGGSSLGAIISLYTVMDRPGVFGRLLLESPSLFISNRQLLKQSLAVRQWPERIFLAVGTRESGREERDKEIVDDVRELEGILRRLAERLEVPGLEGDEPDRLGAGGTRTAAHRRLDRGARCAIGVPASATAGAHRREPQRRRDDDGNRRLHAGR
jgi:enterochelin esterase-like enzyme